MKRKIEFSKIALSAVGGLALIVTFFTLYIVAKTSDTSPLAYLIPAVFTALASAMGFYYNKAKRENEIKLRKKYGDIAREAEKAAEEDENKEVG